MMLFFSIWRQFLGGLFGVWIMKEFRRIQLGSDEKCRIKKFGRTARKLWSAPQLFFTMPRLETYLDSDEENFLFALIGKQDHWRSAMVESHLIFARLNLSPKMSSPSWSPIVGFYGMLCVWAAWLSGCEAVLSPNGTIFEDNCKKTTTCEALKYNTCLGSPLPYTHTSLVLAEDSSTQEEAFEKLTMWSGKN